MNTVSAVSELVAISNLCGGLKDIQTYLLGALKADHFGIPAAKEVFERVSIIVKKGRGIPTIQLIAEDMSLSEEAQDLLSGYKKCKRLKELDNAKQLLDLLNSYRIVRVCLDCSDKTLKLLESKQTDVYKVVSEYEKAVYAAKMINESDEELVHIGKEGNAHKIVSNIINGNITSFIPTGFKHFDKINGGFRRKGLIIIAATTSGGKAQPLNSKIKVPNGWVRMGDIKLGDLVSTPDGKSVPVTGIFPQGIRPTYRVTFEDGRTVDCDENHLWKVYNRYWVKSSTRKKDGSYVYHKRDPWKVLSLKEIIKLRERPSNKLYIPLLKEVYNDEKDLPLDPYVLGLLIGDGSFVSGSVEFFTIDEENIKNLDNKLIEGYSLNKSPNSIRYRLTHGKKGTLNYYIEALKKLNLWGHYSYEKFIPEIYKESSTEQRLEILRGLMDTDGSVNHKEKGSGSISYSTSSYKLALDVQYLVRSLGGLCKIIFRKTSYKYKGVKKHGRTCFKCCIRHDFPENFMKLNRKSERAVKSLNRTLRCKIKSIKYLGMQKTQCIMVDHSDHLYITDGFTVTHNSAMALQLLINMYRQGRSVALVSLEMDQEELFSRILANIAQVDSLDILFNRTSNIERTRMDRAWQEFNDIGKKKNCRFSLYTPTRDVSITDVCYGLNRFNFEALIVDYVSLLSDSTGEDSWRALGEIARFMKLYAKSQDMVGVLLCQLSEDNKIRYSRTIKEHADNVWSWVYNRDVAEETGHIITVDQQKARNQQIFSFRVTERFCNMSLTDCIDDSDINDPLIDGMKEEETDLTKKKEEVFNISDNLEEF